MMTDQDQNSEVSFPDPAPAASSGFQVTARMLASLHATRPWVRFLAVMGFIGVGFMVLIGAATTLGCYFFPGMANSGMQPFGNAPLVMSGILNIVMAFLYLMPALYLFRYASSIARIQDGGNTMALESALLNQKSFWKFVGIITLVFLVVSIFGIAAAIAIPAFVASRM